MKFVCTKKLLLKIHEIIDSCKICRPCQLIKFYQLSIQECLFLLCNILIIIIIKNLAWNTNNNNYNSYRVMCYCFTINVSLHINIKTLYGFLQKIV